MSDHEHVAIRDGDRMVCTHCGKVLHELFVATLAEAIGWPTDWAPPDVTTEDQEKGL